MVRRTFCFGQFFRKAHRENKNSEGPARAHDGPRHAPRATNRRRSQLFELCPGPLEDFFFFFFFCCFFRRRAQEVARKGSQGGEEIHGWFVSAGPFRAAPVTKLKSARRPTNPKMSIFRLVE